MKPIPSPSSLNSSAEAPFASEREALPADRLARQVRCPTCHQSFVYGESKFRPFCSERCRLVDLGRWFKEEYKVAAEDQTPEDEDAVPPRDEDSSQE